MAGQLTERQQEIKRLLDQGATPKEVAAALGITENGVYQQRRRIRDNFASASSRKTQHPMSATAVAGPRRATTAKLDAPRATTPLEAVRTRRKAIHEELGTTEAAVVAADKALKQAQEAHGKATQRYADELTQLDTAEAVLSGKAPKARTQSRKRANARKTEPAPAATTTDAPATSNGAAEAEVAHAAAEAPQTEERPGVPTVDEFAQTDDFGSAA